MVIQVTQEIIDIAEANKSKGLTFHPSYCLGAIALKQVFPTQTIYFGVDDVSIDGIYYKVPNIMEQAVRDYLNDRKVEPFEFEFDIEDEKYVKPR